MASTKIALSGQTSRMQRRSIPLRNGWWLALAVCGCAMLVVLVQAGILSSQRDLLSITAASREARVVFAGFHDAERDERGRYRWTTGDSIVTFPQIGRGAGFALLLHLGPPPVTLPAPQMVIRYNDGAPIRFATNDQPRLYRLLVPPTSTGQVRVRVQSDIVQVAGDPRTVGVRVESVELRPYGATLVWPGLMLIAVESAILALMALLLHALKLRLSVVVAGLLVVALALAWVSVIQMVLIVPYLVRLAVAMALLVALTYGGVPWLVRRLGADWALPLWGATLLAMLVRLTGALYPTFTAHDLPLNVERLLTTVSGDLLVTNRSFEFGGGVTIYPPGPYLALQWALLLGIAPPVLVAGGIALLDGLSALSVGLLARALGLGQRGALGAALLYAGMPVSLMALFFGHTAQAFGQSMMVPLLLALLAALQRPTESRRWLLAALPLSVALLSHIGVTVIAVAWLGLSWLALVPQRNVSWQGKWRFGALLAGCALLALALIYGSVLGAHLAQTQEIGSEALEEGFAPAYWLIWRGFVIAFNGAGLLLAPIGLLVLARRSLPPGGRELVGAWIGTAVLFLAVELISGLQVRYIYFLTPIVCVLLGCVLERLAAISLLGRRLAAVATLVLILQGWIVWYNGVFFAERVSMVALLR